MRRDPHLVLGAGVAVVLGLELGLHATSARYALEALVAGAALAAAWRRQNELRLGPLLVLGVALQVGLVAIHLVLDVAADIDAARIYPREGQALLDGTYPRAEYPPGAVLLFALETWLGGGAARTANALVMVPFQTATVAALWSLRTRLSPWLAAFVALWPLNAFFWEFRFDVAPTACLASGIALAWRGRWGWSGVALGVGTALKWAPALAFVPLALWLLAARRRRESATHAAGFLAALGLLYLPFLLWKPDEVLDAFRLQGGRGITPEALWYLPLHAAGLAHVATDVYSPAAAPGWAKPAAAAVQVVAVLVLTATAARARSTGGAIALSALCPAAFLLLNRIFSPQFLVVLFVAWAAAGALALPSRRAQLCLGAAAGTTSFLNLLVYPIGKAWEPASAAMFLLGIALTLGLGAAALRADRRADRGAEAGGSAATLCAGSGR